MPTRFLRSLAAFGAIHACCVLTTSVLADGGSGSKSDSREQAVIGVQGSFLADGGFQLDSVTADGPATRLERVDGGSGKKGSLRKGDVILKVDGRWFFDQREYFDLLNDA